jgi:phosphate transport system substrate-binding protein
MKLNLAAIPLILAVLPPWLPASGPGLVIRGSDTLVPVSHAWAEAYTARHADVKIDSAGGGAAAAFAALAERKINLALVSRSMRYKEAQPCETAFGQPPAGLKVGVSGVAVYVSAANPLKVITYDELVAIFRGRYRNWKQLGGKDAAIAVYGQDTNSAAGELFVEEVLEGKTLAGDVRLLAGSDVRSTVAKDVHAIGFAAFAPAEGARALAIKRVFSSTPVEPSDADIANRIYPISRFLYAYLDPAVQKGDLAAFLDWIRGDEGQEVARKTGFYPLPAKWRASQ